MLYASRGCQRAEDEAQGRHDPSIGSCGQCPGAEVPTEILLYCAALQVALDALCTPAVILDESNAIVRANAAAEHELTVRAQAFAGALELAVQNESRAAFELLPIQHGCRLAIHRGDPSRERDAVQRAVQRWQLTAKQARVLRLLAEGHANKTIAASLDCAENTIEYHVTRLLEKASVENRTELVAAFWRAAGPIR
jgi:DNA-binding CsgD family transcriptional regulator